MMKDTRETKVDSQRVDMRVSASLWVLWFSCDPAEILVSCMNILQNAYFCTKDQKNELQGKQIFSVRSNLNRARHSIVSDFEMSVI